MIDDYKRILKMSSERTSINNATPWLHSAGHDGCGAELIDIWDRHVAYNDLVNEWSFVPQIFKPVSLPVTQNTRKKTRYNSLSSRDSQDTLLYWFTYLEEGLLSWSAIRLLRSNDHANCNISYYCTTHRFSLKCQGKSRYIGTYGQ